LKELQKSLSSENTGIKPENRKKMLDKIQEINAMVVKQNEQIQKVFFNLIFIQNKNFRLLHLSNKFDEKLINLMEYLTEHL
jgi:uncharacterized protein YllA (UPF0747 family)